MPCKKNRSYRICNKLVKLTFLPDTALMGVVGDWGHDSVERDCVFTAG